MGSTASPYRLRGLDVAIIGGGITGMTLALGLQARGVKYKIYERAPAFHEIGAGVGFSPNAERAMKMLDPAMHAAYKKVANPNGEDYFQWKDGFGKGELIYKLYLGEDMFQGCRRSDFIDELAKLVPKQNVAFSKEIQLVFDDDDGRPNVIFTDGECVIADIVIGCDGIRSRVRQLLLGEDNPASYPGYTHKYCFRALIGACEARKSLEKVGCNGKFVTSTRFMYNGADQHVITYPVAMGTLLNLLAVVSDDKEWNPEDGKHTAKTTKKEVENCFRSWNRTVGTLVDMLPEELDKWAIFDMLDHPAPKYNDGCVCIAGDAAHAAGPHLGAGAGFGIEDALVLATALECVDKKVKLAYVSKPERVEMSSKALTAYNQVRYERTQWLVMATRQACSLFQTVNNESMDRTEFNEEFGRRISDLFRTIWDYDITRMVEKTVAEFGGTRTGDTEEVEELWLMGSL